MTKYTTNSLQQTIKLGKKFVNKLNTNIIGLIGELGSGKTAFTKGVGQYLQINNITSPSFVIMKVYKLKNKKYNNLVHVDCYRLKNYESLIDIGLEECLPAHHSLRHQTLAGGNDKKNLIIIEWADKIRSSLPKHTKYIKFKLGKNENQRIIKFY